MAWFIFPATMNALTTIYSVAFYLTAKITRLGDLPSLLKIKLTIILKFISQTKLCLPPGQKTGVITICFSLVRIKAIGSCLGIGIYIYP